MFKDDFISIPYYYTVNSGLMHTHQKAFEHIRMIYSYESQRITNPPVNGELRIASIIWQIIKYDSEKDLPKNKKAGVTRFFHFCFLNSKWHSPAINAISVLLSCTRACYLPGSSHSQFRDYWRVLFGYRDIAEPVSLRPVPNSRESAALWCVPSGGLPLS